MEKWSNIGDFDDVLDRGERCGGVVVWWKATVYWPSSELNLAT